jgi:ankyrin repeat protein
LVLARCVWQGRAGEVQRLLKAKADANAVSPDGFTALIVAALLGRLRIARLLLRAGKADANLCNRNGASPLFIAAQEGNVEFARLLLREGKRHPAVYGC